MLFFWWMDARYLYLQKGFIELFKAVSNGENKIHFEMSYRNYARSIRPTWFLFLTWPVSPFYGVLLIVMLTLSLGIYFDLLGFDSRTPQQCDCADTDLTIG